MKIGYIASLEWKIIFTNCCFRLHVYLHTNKTLIHNYLCVFEKWGKNLNHKKVQYNYSTKMFTRRAKPIRIIGVPDNQRPDEWSSTVLTSKSLCNSSYFSQTNTTLEIRTFIHLLPNMLRSFHSTIIRHTTQEHKYKLCYGKGRTGFECCVCLD